MRRLRGRCLIIGEIPDDKLIMIANRPQQPASLSENLLATIMSDETFRPNEPVGLADTGLPVSLIEGLIIKRLAIIGITSGRQMANDICIPFQVLEGVFQTCLLYTSPSPRD